MPERRTKDITLELHTRYYASEDDVDIFEALSEYTGKRLPCGDEAFELCELRATENAVTGVVRKFQDDNFPYFGIRRRAERPLGLPDKAALINRVHFRLCRQDGLLVLQRNGRICTANRFAALLSEIANETVIFSPVLDQNQIDKLLNYSNQIRRINLGFSSNPHAVQVGGDDFSDHAMNMLRGHNGYAGVFEMRSNGKSTDPDKRFLDRNLADVIPRWVRRGEVVKAKVWVEDLYHPIDLFADRVVDVAQIRFNGRYPIPESIDAGLRDAAEKYFNGRLG